MYGSMANATVKEEESKVLLDVRAEVRVTIEEIFHGTVKEVAYTQEYPNSQNLILTREVSKRVIIAPGANEKHEMKFKGEGNQGFDVSQRSDLIIKIVIEKNPLFTKRDSNLVMTYAIPLGKALNCESLRFKVFRVNDEDETINYPVDQVIDPKTVL